MRRGLAEALAMVVLVAAMAAVLAGEAWGDSLTYDEGKYIAAGWHALHDGSADFEATNPVGFKLLAGAGQLLVAPPDPGGRSVLAYFTRHRADGVAVPRDDLREVVLAGRAGAILVAIAVLLLAWAWARSLFGTLPALAVAALVALEPTLLAHGHLATGDAPLTLGVVGCLAARWHFSTHGRRRMLVLGGLALGFALLAKLSALALLPVLVVIEAVEAAPPRTAPASAGRAIANLAITVGTAWATVCAAYLPLHTTGGTPGAWGAPLSWIAPPSWLYGLRYQAGHVGGGATSYLDGVARQGRGFSRYFAEAFLFKSTLGFLLLVAAAVAVLVARRHRAACLYLLLPALTLAGAATLGGIDIGVRYLLPIFPLLAVAGGALFTGAATARRAAAAVLLAASVVASAAAYPYHLAYFNQLAGGRPESHLADSNLDWGQDAWRLRDWWQAAGRPELAADYFGALPLSAYGIDARPVDLRFDAAAGRVAVSVQKEVVYGEAGRPPLRGRHSTRVGSSIDVFDLDRP